MMGENPKLLLDGLAAGLFPYLCQFLWQATLLLLFAWLITRGMKRKNCRREASLWLVVVLFAPLCPWATSHLPAPPGGSYPLAVLPAAPSKPVVENLQPSAFVAASEPDRFERMGLGARLEPPSFQQDGWSTSHWAVVLYALGVAFFTTLLLVGALRIRFWVLTASGCREEWLVEMLENQKTRLGITKKVEILQTRAIPWPLATGGRHPAILVPEGFLQTRPRAEVEAVILHELSHLKANDPALLRILALLCAVFFFHPLVWIARQRVREALEKRADRSVLDHLPEPLNYAKALIRTASDGKGEPACVRGNLLGLLRGVSLRDRIEDLLAPAPVRVTGIRNSTTVWFLLVLLVLLPSLWLTAIFPLHERKPESPIRTSMGLAEEVPGRTFRIGEGQDYGTIAEALAQASTGDRLRITDSRDYEEDLQVTFPVSIIGNPDRPPTLSGSVLFSSQGGNFQAENLIFSNTRGDGLQILSATGSAVLVDRCRFAGNEGYGLYLQSSRTQLHVSDSVFEQNAKRGIQVGHERTSDPLISQSSIRIERCSFSENGLSHSLNSTERGRAVEVESLDSGTVVVKDTTIRVTQDGLRDRGIQLDSLKLSNNTFEFINCLVEAPLYDASESTGNREGIGLKIKAATTTVTLRGCRFRGFKDAAEFKTRGQAFRVDISDSEFIGFANGRGITIQGINGQVRIARVALIGNSGADQYTGDEGLRITKCTNLTADLSHITTGNTEEGITIDECPQLDQIYISDVVLRKGDGRGEKGLKLSGNDTSRIVVSNVSVGDFQTAVECFNKGSNQEVFIKQSVFDQNSRAILVKGERGTHSNRLNLSECAFLMREDLQSSVGLDVNDDHSRARVEVARSTFHRYGTPILTGESSVATVEIRESIFSEWSHEALSHHALAFLNEDSNLFADSDLSPVSQDFSRINRSSRSKYTQDSKQVFHTAALGEVSPLMLCSGGLAFLFGGPGHIGAGIGFEGESEPATGAPDNHLFGATESRKEISAHPYFLAGRSTSSPNPVLSDPRTRSLHNSLSFDPGVCFEEQHFINGHYTYT